ncbi:MAG: DNA-directed RNA polymerase subunit alpha [Planctomycetaceae bacterium]|jgi:DNA-directed RNA polymerase subunit alpha|nr:DNA-directed RNA polymerase subunit alpha [Planctomycetaceae bacterium]MBT6153969.1 DNA-directed RNA polymerase subunit alpha [Planctomycetaceae bacterium]MBT6483729.1 DNA-directed RNA polymerase subunit alpha [Planctomycetaceae bacterium]MBT6496995.1 DNA-directed RNA polymerase subunit alpha [Planctomycetaceae bacterium]
MRIRWRGLELPSRVALETETATPTYGAFVAEPFERGFGATIGNSLRRILLSSLEGSAVSRVKIQGVQHEFATIPGVVEDVVDICLNLKSLIIKNHSSSERTLRIERHERGVVTGADVITDDKCEIVNKDLLIATMTDDVPLNIELTVKNGRGYVPASEQQDEFGGQEQDVIPLDATFTPVVRVRYKNEDTRVGQRTNYDKLTMEIWTDGTITPEMALVEAAKIMRKHLNPFITYREPGPELPPDGGLKGMADATGYSPLDLELEEKLNQSLAELNLSVRATNCLESEGINTVRDLVSRAEDQLLQVRNFGETTLHEVRERLDVIGLRLGMKVPESTITG